jgi:hypothetical protein
MYLQTNIKHELVEDEPSEHENEEDHEDETSDVNHRLDFPASTSTNLVYPIQPISTKTIVNEFYAFKIENKLLLLIDV